MIQIKKKNNNKILSHTIYDVKRLNFPTLLFFGTYQSPFNLIIYMLLYQLLFLLH